MSARHLVIGYVGRVRGPRPARTWCGAPAATEKHAYRNTPEQPTCQDCAAALSRARRVVRSNHRAS